MILNLSRRSVSVHSRSSKRHRSTSNAHKELGLTYPMKATETDSSGANIPFSSLMPKNIGYLGNSKD